jgi:TonB family protein
VKCALKFQVAMLVFYSIPLLAQNSPADQKQQPSHVELRNRFPSSNCPSDGSASVDSGLSQDKQGRALGAVDVLSDTMGVDFGPYLARVLHDVKKNWYSLIPESARPPLKKKGKVSIEFAILKDGSVSGMRLADCGSSGDVKLDRAAWGGIVASRPFPPLPPEFGGEYLALRMHFLYNPDKLASRSGIKIGLPEPSSIQVTVGPSSGIRVSLPEPSSVRVTVGSSYVLTPAMTGTTNTAVKWSVTGEGCSGSACGTMQGDLYIAPRTVPSPPAVTLTATSEADPTASTSITINLLATKDTK